MLDNYIIIQKTFKFNYSVFLSVDINEQKKNNNK